MTCDRCGHEMQIGEFPFCPHDKQANSVIGDEIDITIKNGMCWPDATPRRWRSRQALKEATAKAGLINKVRHIGTKGGDRSPHTTRWY